MGNQPVLLNETIEFETATADDLELQQRFNQISEINDILINLFHKAYVISQTILTSELSEATIKKQHHDFVEMLTMSQAVSDMVAKKKTVNEMIAFYLLGAKTQAEKILLDAESEAEQIVKQAQVVREERFSEKGSRPVASAKVNAQVVAIPNRISKLSELERELAAIIVQLENQVDDAINSIDSYKMGG